MQPLEIDDVDNSKGTTVDTRPPRYLRYGVQIDFEPEDIRNIDRFDRSACGVLYD